MKQLFTILAVVGLYSALWAQKPVFAQAQLASARVYYNGAELVQKANVQLAKGTSEVVITNVANYLNEGTVQIGTPASVTVLSVQFSNRYLEEYDSKASNALHQGVRDSIQSVELQLQKLNNSLDSQRKTIDLLDANQALGGVQSGFSVAELTKMVEYYKSKRIELLNAADLMVKQQQKLQLQLQHLSARLDFNTDKEQKNSQGKLILQVMSDKAVAAPFQITYLTNQAHWAPFYDLRVEQINLPIKMTYKAELVQTSGLDWKDVKLSLTSGKANQTNALPTWDTWFVDYDYNLTAAKRIQGRSAAVMLSESSVRNSAVPSPPVVELGEMPVEEYSYNSLDQWTSVAQNQLNLTFNIDLPYTILSNGKKHSVALKDLDIPSTYSYYSLPKLDQNAYLMAEVKDYGNYNLLPGTANVIFDGVYVGKTFLNPENTEEKLSLSMGKDAQVSVSRLLVNDKSGTKMMSSKKVQNFVYEITVRNNKKEAVDLTVEDQYPISSNADIEVELIEKDGATVQQEKGLLSWKIKLKANETKKLRFAYQLKYAKDKTISGL